MVSTAEPRDIIEKMEGVTQSTTGRGKIRKVVDIAGDVSLPPFCVPPSSRQITDRDTVPWTPRAVSKSNVPLLSTVGPSDPTNTLRSADSGVIWTMRFCHSSLSPTLPLTRKCGTKTGPESANTTISFATEHAGAAFASRIKISAGISWKPAAGSGPLLTGLTVM